MTLFEYLTAGYVLILSFAVIRALSGFPHALSTTSRYWVHISWLALALANCLVTFWAFWSYRDTEWTLPSFAIVLATPALLFVYNSILVPADPASVRSWRKHFFNVRVPLFATGALSVVLIVATNHLVLGMSLLHPVVIGGVAWLAIYLVGLSSERPGLHAVLAFALLLVFAVAMLTFLAQPGSLSRAIP